MYKLHRSIESRRVRHYSPYQHLESSTLFNEVPPADLPTSLPKPKPGRAAVALHEAALLDANDGLAAPERYPAPTRFTVGAWGSRGRRLRRTFHVRVYAWGGL